MGCSLHQTHERLSMENNGFLLKDKTMTKEEMEGWIARDKFQDTLVLFSDKPYRSGSSLGLWKCSFGSFFTLSKEMFPDVKWEDEPIEVELTIHRV